MRYVILLVALSLAPLVFSPAQAQVLRHPLDAFPDVVSALDEAIASRTLDFDSFRVGIVSSGIDYTHPALGSGLGAQFTVVGGYDFALDDPDPYDDYLGWVLPGRGTLWAGIIAGNAPNVYRGVAPGAKLVAHKVLTGRRIPEITEIAEGIARTADPDGDGDSRDRLFMAVYGGSLFNWNAKIRAADTAADAGVLMIIRNYRPDGPDADRYFTSANVSEDVLSVGFADASGNILGRSAWGPTASYILKPDLLAPEVDMYTTRPGPRYMVEAAGEGAMAASVVTGTMALIKASNPEWSAAQVRSAVINTTSDLERPMMQQGAGMLDIEAAINATSTFEPAILNVGAYVSSEVIDTYQRTLQLTIANDDTEAATYRVVMPVPPVGVSWSISDNNFTVQPGESVEVELVFELKKADAQFDPNTYAIGDYFRVVTDAQTYRLPWYLVDQVAAANRRAATNVETETQDAFGVAGNYPNPFSTTTTIAYALENAEEVEITVFNMVGQQVSAISAGYQSAGQHEVMFEAGTLPSGMYYYHVSAGSERVTQTMTIVR